MLISEINDGNIQRFQQKVATGYLSPATSTTTAVYSDSE